MEQLLSTVAGEVISEVPLVEGGGGLHYCSQQLWLPMSCRQLLVTLPDSGSPVTQVTTDLVRMLLGGQYKSYVTSLKACF